MSKMTDELDRAKGYIAEAEGAAADEDWAAAGRFAQSATAASAGAFRAAQEAVREKAKELNG